MWILIFLLISQSLTEKSIWDGNKRGLEFFRDVTFMDNDQNIFWQGDISRKGKTLIKDITFLKYVTLRNVKILEVDINKYVPRITGVHFQIKNGNKRQSVIMRGTQSKKRVAYTFNIIKCQISFCDVGFKYMTDSKGTDMLHVKLNDLKGIFYLKFVTNDMILRLDKFNIDGYNFPLILCPYKNWVNKYSGTTFVPYERNGIEFSSLRGHQILLPGYPRNDDIDVFVCGYINYEDGSQLTIGHEIAIKDYYSTGSIKSISDFQHIWKCSEGEAAADYYYFIHTYNVEGNHKMRQITKDSVNKNKFYYNDIMYLYKKADTRNLMNMKNGIQDDYVMKQINPTCKWKLPHLKYKLRLVSFDGSGFYDSGDYTNIINIHKDTLNKNTYYKCEIVIEEAAKYPFLSNYYDKVMDVVLVSRDDYGNKIFHDKIKFDDTYDGFKKYECEVRHKNDDFWYGYPSEILSFLTISSDIPVTYEDDTWRLKDDVIVQCQRNISNIGEIDSIRVHLSKNVFIGYSNVTNSSMFSVDGDFVTLRNRNLMKINKQEDVDIKYLITQCNYKVKGEKKTVIIENNPILKMTKINKKVYEDNRSSNALIKIGLIIGILMLLVLIILIIVLLHIDKNMDENRRGDSDSSLSTSDSTTNFSTSSLSGMPSKNTTAKKTQSKVSKINK
uniref:Ig-like domain-containing protein n=1 Tax=Strongyloides papillosus TaxID=174720 RepID=A0A0N5CGG2_STREA